MFQWRFLPVMKITSRMELLSVLRIVAGLQFLEHGVQKIFGFPAMAIRPKSRRSHADAIMHGGGAGSKTFSAARLILGVSS